MAFGFKCQPLLFGLGEGFDALALDFGRLQNGGDQLAFAALDFGVLHRDLTFLFHLLDLDLLRDHLLLHDVGLDLVGLIGRRLLLLDGFLDSWPS